MTKASDRIVRSSIRNKRLDDCYAALTDPYLIQLPCCVMVVCLD
jgi:hypothetical protein